MIIREQGYAIVMDLSDYIIILGDMKGHII